MVTAGNISVDQLTLDSTFKDLEAPSATIVHQMVIRATLDGLAFTPPGLPSVAELDGKLDYVDGLLTSNPGSRQFRRVNAERNSPQWRSDPGNE